MEQIPDTGGGLSGFFAYLIWHAYRYFPFEGRWGWLLLVAILALAVRVAHLPFLWRIVERQMQALSCVDDTWRKWLRRTTRISICWIAWSVVCYLLLLAFFGSFAGQTLLRGRQLGWELFPAIDDWLVSSLGLLALLIVALAIVTPRLSQVGHQRKSREIHEGPRPFRKRTLRNVFFGRGVFICRTDDAGSYVAVPGWIGLVVELLMYWTIPFVVILSGIPPVAEPVLLALTAAFAVSRLLTEIFRMGFVYVLHRQTFS